MADRSRMLKAARDALVIECVLAVALSMLALAIFTHQGLIVWP